MNYLWLSYHLCCFLHRFYHQDVDLFIFKHQMLQWPGVTDASPSKMIPGLAPTRSCRSRAPPTQCCPRGWGFEPDPQCHVLSLPVREGDEPRERMSDSSKHIQSSGLFKISTTLFLDLCNFSTLKCLKMTTHICVFLWIYFYLFFPLTIVFSLSCRWVYLGIFTSEW